MPKTVTLTWKEYEKLSARAESTEKRRELREQIGNLQQLIEQISADRDGWETNYYRISETLQQAQRKLEAAGENYRALHKAYEQARDQAADAILSSPTEKQQLQARITGLEASGRAAEAKFAELLVDHEALAQSYADLLEAAEIAVLAAEDARRRLRPWNCGSTPQALEAAIAVVSREAEEYRD